MASSAIVTIGISPPRSSPPHCGCFPSLAQPASCQPSCLRRKLNCSNRWPGCLKRCLTAPAQSCLGFRSALRLLPQFGTTCVVPTIVPPAKAELLEPLARLFETLPHGAGAVVPGFHLEGPFVALGGSACTTLPGDLRLLKDLLAACGRH